MITLLLSLKILENVFLQDLDWIKLIKSFNIILFLNQLFYILFKFLIIRKAIWIIPAIFSLMKFLITFWSRLTLSLFLLLIYIKLNFLLFFFLIKVKISYFTLFLCFSRFHIWIYFLEIQNYSSKTLNLIFWIEFHTMSLCSTTRQFAALVYIFWLYQIIAWVFQIIIIQIIIILIKIAHFLIFQWLNILT